MIKENELRLGNYIIEDGRETEFNGDFYHWCSDIMKPIPLTEEWLIKFGMDYTDGFSNSRKLYVKKHKHDTSNITYSEKEGVLRLTNGNPKGSMLIPHIKYVHQLQNLYFSLTGEELTIKEND